MGLEGNRNTVGEVQQERKGKQRCMGGEEDQSMHIKYVVIA
jgi:hypothetical protein